jgi:protein-S-isoprenylcysteine O-methyltransferase Ste14
MKPIVRGALVTGVAVTLAVALLILSVALTGEELTLEASFRSCVRSGGVLLAVAAVALVAGLVIALRGVPSVREADRRIGRRS